jgi:uncharacterized protein YqhQ
MPEVPARPYIGGQAVIEGVMMRSPGSMSIVCRRRSGELVVRERPVVERPGSLRKLPFIRGVVTVVESLKMGSQAMRWAVKLYEEDWIAEEEGGSRAPATKGPSVLSMLALSMIALGTQEDGKTPPPFVPEEKRSSLLTLIPIVCAIALFVALPQFAAEGLNKVFNLGLAVNSPGLQAITGASKLVIVVVMYSLFRRIPDVFRTFQYHGAEHKSITTYEAQEELVVENARRKPTLHARCGTTFLVMVALVSILVFTAVGALLPVVSEHRVVQSVAFFFMKLPFLPFIAAITFEIQRIFARYCTTGPLRALLWPGFLVQKITTAEPDDTQLEVALASLHAALWREAAREAPAPADRVFPSYGEVLADPGYARA